MRKLYHNIFHGNCSNVISRSMASSRFQLGLWFHKPCRCTVDWHERVEASSNDAHWIVLGKTRSLALFWFEGWV
jgi:hypothetical protein